MPLCLSSGILADCNNLDLLVRQPGDLPGGLSGLDAQPPLDRDLPLRLPLQAGPPAEAAGVLAPRGQIPVPVRRLLVGRRVLRGRGGAVPAGSGRRHRRLHALRRPVPEQPSHSAGRLRADRPLRPAVAVGQRRLGQRPLGPQELHRSGHSHAHQPVRKGSLHQCLHRQLLWSQHLSCKLNFF